jgi:hypothetical protein
MSKGNLMMSWRSSLLLPTAGIVLATPFLVWFAIGEQSFRGSALDDYLAGPYDVGPESGNIVFVVAAIIAAVSISVLVIRTRQGVAGGRSWAVVTVLVGAGSLGAAGWRAITAGVGGANIGGGAAALVFPPLIAGLLVVGVWLAGGGGRHSRRWTWILTLAAVLVAPGLYAFLYAIGNRPNP